MYYATLLVLLPAQFIVDKDFTKDLQQFAARTVVNLNGRNGAIVGRSKDFVYVLTANHLVQGEDGVIVRAFPVNSPHDQTPEYGAAEVLARSKERDLALVRVAAKNPPAPLRVALANRVPKEKLLSVVSIGTSDGKIISSVLDRSATKKLVQRPGVEKFVFYWQVREELAKERSGSPLVSRDGALVGLCSGLIEGKGYFCHIDEIRAFLKLNGFAWIYEDPEKGK